MYRFPGNERHVVLVRVQVGIRALEMCFERLASCLLSGLAGPHPLSKRE
jgi:hypothetical protein